MFTTKCNTIFMKHRNETAREKMDGSEIKEHQKNRVKDHHTEYWTQQMETGTKHSVTKKGTWRRHQRAGIIRCYDADGSVTLVKDSSISWREWEIFVISLVLELGGGHLFQITTETCPKASRTVVFSTHAIPLFP